VAHVAGFAVFFAIEPFLGAVRRLELKNDDPLRVPIPFQHFGFSAAHDVFAAVFFDGRAGKIFVLFISNRIDNVDIDDDVGGHGR